MKTSSQHFSVPAVELVPAASASAGWGRLLGSCARAAVVVMLVSGIAYPLATTGIAQISMPQAANGSLVLRNGQIVGSALIGQQFDSAPYFHGRPSATLAAFSATQAMEHTVRPTLSSPLVKTA